MRPKSLPRGLHEVHTITGASMPVATRNRVQAAAVVARLERERARLEDEIRARTLTQRKLEERLKRVHVRLAAMRDTLPAPANGEGAEGPAPEVQGARYQAFSLEY